MYFGISKVFELEERWSEVYPPRGQGVFFQKDMFVPGESAWPNPGEVFKDFSEVFVEEVYHQIPMPLMPQQAVEEQQLFQQQEGYYVPQF